MRALRGFNLRKIVSREQPVFLQLIGDLGLQPEDMQTMSRRPAVPEIHQW